jgi:hypothetical protein
MAEEVVGELPMPPIWMQVVVFKREEHMIAGRELRVPERIKVESTAGAIGCSKDYPLTT